MKMTPLLIGGWIPAPYSIAVGGDGAWLAVVAILAMAIAVTVALVFAARPARALPIVKQMPQETLRKAA
jgi:hypothetical protein